MAEEVEGTETILALPDPEIQESLQSENEVDTWMEGEQTWPTEEELKEADVIEEQKRLVRVPKGMGAYQATWIMDEDLEDAEEYEDEDDDEGI